MNVVARFFAVCANLSVSENIFVQERVSRQPPLAVLLLIFHLPHGVASFFRAIFCQFLITSHVRRSNPCRTNSDVVVVGADHRQLGAAGCDSDTGTGHGAIDPVGWSPENSLSGPVDFEDVTERRTAEEEVLDESAR